MTSKGFDDLTRKGTQLSVFGIFIILLWFLVQQAQYYGSMKFQVEQIHKTQILLVKTLRELESTASKRDAEIEVRLSQLELTNKMLDLPIYKDPETKRVYIDGR